MEHRQRRRKKRSMSFVSKAMILVLLVFGIYGIWSFITDFIGNDGIGNAISNPLTVEGNAPNGNSTVREPGNSNPTGGADLNNANAANNPNNSPVAETGNSVNTFAMSGQSTSIALSDIADTGYLKLVNREHGMSREPDRSLIVDAWPTVPVSTRDITLHISARTAVSELFDAARNDNSIGTFFVSSGYRDISAQDTLYNSGMDRAFVLPPGHSEHHTGLGIDILAIEIGQFELANTAEGRWLADNSWKFGLILRYPESRQAITGIAYEPWHFRFVGQPHAWYMWEHDMVLEEYLEFLREIGGYAATVNGREYIVLYQVPVDGMLQIPQNYEFRVSSDNMGGYVITAW